MTNLSGGLQMASPGAANRHKVPPPPTWPRNELDLIKDCDSVLGLALWRLVRDVRLWAAVPPDDRREAFRPRTDEARERLACAVREAPEIARPLELLAAVSWFPEMARPAEVADACRRVMEWADERRMMETALQYAEAAALADPDEAGLAYAAGRITRRAGADFRSAAWYQRAIGLARRHRDSITYIEAHLGYGNLLFQTGDYANARPYHLKAARKAVRAGRRDLAGAGHHNLLTLESARGDWNQAEFHFRKALELYPVRYSRVCHLVHDYAHVIMRKSHFSCALGLLDLLEPRFAVRNPMRILLAANIGRASAGLRDHPRFADARAEVIELAGISDEGAPAALVLLAEGARELRLWDVAEELSARALEIAMRRRERDAQRIAAELLDSIALRRAPEASRDVPPPPAVRELTRTISARLKKVPRADTP
jgi:tetratricopeptide (TPR) repeat protein